jgi:hypothetical protein
MRDRGIWITWYDLPEDDRDRYLAWLHQRYIPLVLDRPGCLWASHYETIVKGDVRVHTDDPTVPQGTRYLLLFGAEYADVFGRPTPARFHATLPAEDREMLSLRIGERVNIMAEAGRVDGLALKDYSEGMVLAPCIQLGSYNCPWQNEEEMLAWYTEVRMPAIAEPPPVGIRIRKLSSVMGWAKHAILYEFTSVEGRHAYFKAHQSRPDMKPWLDWVGKNLTHAPGSSSLGRRIWPPVAISSDNR